MTQHLTVRILDKKERKTTYKQYMKQDFPKNELRPLRMIEKMVDDGDYYTYGVFEAEKMIAYAYLWEEPEREILLFDYFAVIPELRNNGYGTEAMRVLFENCAGKRGIILEAENPDYAGAIDERKTRERRIAFYERCGLAKSNVKLYLFGVDYCMMYRELCGQNVQDEIVTVMETLYKNVLPKRMYEKMVRFE